ncbi:D-alanyl-D-alanine carboxypeptidase/D-alanyl-D-alanine endopeptidase [Rhizocola hellebori]|uniref:D-alanyl-D-alanine carboxypeptidase/D-alanyl-D-alanine endopeptidase n=1 Tax=Rhizocola hellebori TaxID=1392758 RepID=UPI001EF386E2|nr:D-alanyl-D-alanine carboxypeptidase/D-alanyl-D-alanine-endopeptidase [Rhizocola hellebori]
MEKRRKLRPIVLSAALALLLLIGVGGWHWWQNRATFTTPAPASSSEPIPGPVLKPLTGAAVPTGSTLKEQLEPLVVGTVLGKNVSVSVVDLRSGKVLYERDPTNTVIPASNTKLVTAAAVLATRGAAYRITTTAVAGANPGEVVLVGAGDATLAVDGEGFYAGAARLDQLAEQIKKSLGTTKPTKVIVDGSLYSGPVLGPAWEANANEEGYTSKITALMIDGAREDPKDQETPFDRYSDPELAAGQALAKLLGVPNSAVSRGTAPAASGTAAPSASAPIAPGAQLGAVKSAPMLRQLEQMLGHSDNTLAEALARQVALAKGKPASFEGAAEAVEQVLTELGLPVGQFDLADGAGYSTQNQLSPNVLTGLMTRAADGKHAGLADLFNLLPVAGWSGSLDYRFAKPEAASGLGVVRAKSGTLQKVNSISGVVQTADGGLLAFAVLAENVPTWQYPAQDALDRIVAKIASCGCS